MEVYLREYDINPGLMPEFIESWWARVLLLRERCGFTLLGAWADEASDRFVCVLGYAGPGDIDAADAHYQALPEHQPIAQESYRLVKEARITRLAALERCLEGGRLHHATIPSPP